MSVSSASDGLDFVFDLPQAHYKPLKVGVLSRKTKLEEILELTKLPHEDFIWYAEVLKVTHHTHLNLLALSQDARQQALPPCVGD